MTAPLTKFLPEAVASVHNLGRDDIELIVVDDGSTDDRTRKEMDALCRNFARPMARACFPLPSPS